MKRFLIILVSVAACLVLLVGSYWGTEFYLVRRYVKQTVAAAEHIRPADVSIVSLQLLGSHRWVHILQPHYWSVAYRDPRFRTLYGTSPDLGGTLLYVDEPRFGHFSSYTLRSKPPQPPSALTPGVVAGPSLYTLAFADADHGWMGGSAGLYGTADGGKTWHPQSGLRAPVIRVTAVDANSAWALTAKGSLLSTRDGGKHWEPDVAARFRATAFSFPTPTQGWATDGAALFATEDSGASWHQLNAPGHLAALTFVDGRNGWAAGDGRLWQTGDGGKTWRLQVTLPQLAPPAQGWTGPTWVSFADRADGWALFTLGQGFASQEPYELLHTADGGQHWELRLADGLQHLPRSDLQQPVVPTGPGGYPVAFTARQDAAWVLVNSTAGGYVELLNVPGQAAAPVTKGRLSLNAPANAIMDLAVAPAGDLWLVTGDASQGTGQVLHSINGGSTWLPESSGLGDGP